VNGSHPVELIVPSFKSVAKVALYCWLGMHCLMDASSIGEYDAQD
jgi:hypothetical protein